MVQVVGRRWHALLLAACVLFLLEHAANAHAIILSSVPPAGGTVKGSDVGVQLHFNSRIDRQRSKILLISADGKETPMPLDAKSTDDTLVGRTQGVAPGEYRLRWQVLSIDGHITRGDIAFTVVAP